MLKVEQLDNNLATRKKHKLQEKQIHRQYNACNVTMFFITSDFYFSLNA